MKKGLKILMFVLLGILFAAALGFVTMFLWNYVVPPLFNGPVIGFWHALAMLLLAKILFGFGGHGRSCNCQGHRGWKNRYSQKLAAMSPEERERFKELMKNKWCRPTTND